MSLLYWSCEEEALPEEYEDPFVGTWNLLSACHPSDCSDATMNCDDITQLYIDNNDDFQLKVNSDGTAMFILCGATERFGWNGSNPYNGLGKAEGVTFEIFEENLNFSLSSDELCITMTKDDVGRMPIDTNSYIDGFILSGGSSQYREFQGLIYESGIYVEVGETLSLYVNFLDNCEDDYEGELGELTITGYNVSLANITVDEYNTINIVGISAGTFGCKLKQVYDNNEEFESIYNIPITIQGF